MAIGFNIFIAQPHKGMNNSSRFKRVQAGRVGKYARSGFELAKQNNVKVIPLCHNSGDCWPAHKFIKQPGTIKLFIGNAFYVRDSKESANEVRMWVEKKLSS